MLLLLSVANLVSLQGHLANLLDLRHELTDVAFLNELLLGDFLQHRAVGLYLCIVAARDLSKILILLARLVVTAFISSLGASFLGIDGSFKIVFQHLYKGQHLDRNMTHHEEELSKVQISHCACTFALADLMQPRLKLLKEHARILVRISALQVEHGIDDCLCCLEPLQIVRSEVLYKDKHHDEQVALVLLRCMIET